MEEAMHAVTFTLQPDDMRALDWFVWSRRRSMQVLASLLLLLIGVQIVTDVPTLLDALRQGRLSAAVLPVLLLTVPVVGFGFVYLFARTYAYRRLEQRIPGIYAPRTVEVRPDGLVQQDATGESTIQWHAITQITEHRDRVFLMLSPYRGVIVPKRSFATAVEAQTFMEHAHCYWQAARARS